MWKDSLPTGSGDANRFPAQEKELLAASPPAKINVHEEQD
jgi:hypothetical protein